VINPDGKKSAVMVDLDVWEQITTMLEDLEDAEEMKQARTVHEETVYWNAANWSYSNDRRKITRTH
jgi:hypothetical protein